MGDQDMQNINQWHRVRLFVVVKAYPSISKRKGEASCIVALLPSGAWVRLYPVPFRQLDNEQMFTKYTWIEASIKKATDDPRAESYHVDCDSIHVLDHIPTDAGWSQRNALLLPKAIPSLEWLNETRQDILSTTICLIRPAHIERLEIDPTPDDDIMRQQQNQQELHQQLNWFEGDPNLLEIIPYSFRYRFRCNDERCTGHRMKIVDWEIAQSYRRWRDRPQGWEGMIRQKYEQELVQKHLQLFLGTMRLYPSKWIIIGLYYPTSTAMMTNMFDS